VAACQLRIWTTQCWGCWLWLTDRRYGIGLREQHPRNRSINPTYPNLPAPGTLLSVLEQRRSRVPVHQGNRASYWCGHLDQAVAAWLSLSDYADGMCQWE
jgi:hypothetical protein